MAEEVALQLKINALESAKTLKDLKSGIKDLSNEMLNVKEGSKEFQSLAKSIGNAKEKTKDLKEATNLFTKGGTVSEIANVGQTIAGGFAAAQGAMALFGSESENVQKQLLKVQAGIAIVEGIKSAIAGWESVQRLLNLAMAANPIGAIIAGVVLLTTAIGYLISSSDGLAEATDEVNKRYKKQNEELEKSVDLIKKKQAAQQSGMKFQLDLAKAKGASDEELYKMERALIEKQIHDVNEVMGFKTQGVAAEIKQKTELQKQLALLDAGFVTDQKEEKDKADKEASDKAKKQREDDAQALRDFNVDFQSEIAKNILADDEATAKAEEVDDAKKKSKNEKELADINAKNKTASEVADKKAKDDIAREKAVSQAKFDIANAGISSLMSLGAIFSKDQKKNAELQKKLAVVQLAVDSAKAVAGAVANSQDIPFPGNLAAMAVGIAAVLANIAKAKQLLSKAGATGGGDISAGGAASSSAISAPVKEIGTSTFGTNDKGDLNGTKQTQVVKAYVVESELTSSQANIASIQKKSKIQ